MVQSSTIRFGSMSTGLRRAAIRVSARLARISSAWPTAGRDLLLLGAYLSIRGYHSLDGDQAYRLPLLLHWLDPALYVSDPFVRAFDSFNPHRGWLSLLWMLTSTIGMSAGLFLLFTTTFLATCRGVDRLARSTWPEIAGRSGFVAIVLLLSAKAGNIGTNHLFEATVLDRLVALALGWNAIACVVDSPGVATIPMTALLGLAAFVHPSMGLQLALILSGTWLVCGFMRARTSVNWSQAFRNVGSIFLGVMPGLLLNLRNGHLLLEGLAPKDFWTLSVELQSPQHMLPHLWRFPQWLAWASYFVLAFLPVRGQGGQSVTRTRLLLLMLVVMAWLAAGWVGVELFRHTRLTVFQPFRLATLARGLALILLSGRLLALWSRGTWLPRARVWLTITGLTGDWTMVIVTAIELCVTAAEYIPRPLARFDQSSKSILLARGMTMALFLFSLCCGLTFLARHDTESGQQRIMLALLGCLAFGVLGRRMDRVWSPDSPSQRRYLFAVAWALPCLAFMAGLVPEGSWLTRTAMIRSLVDRCRFTAVPTDDVERLAIWCRDHTPPSSRFVGPPGPKTFRLWSQRSLVFNRAGSPYHAAGLLDWFERFRDVVNSSDDPQAFALRYQTARHQLESRYSNRTPQELADLALRQGADHIIIPRREADELPSEADSRDGGPLLLLHVEGNLAVYRLQPRFTRHLREQNRTTFHPIRSPGSG